MAKKIKVLIEVLSLQEEGYHLFIQGKLGEPALRLLIDTGASKTVLDKSFITEHFPEFKLEINEQLTTGVGNNTIQSEFTEISNLKIGDLEIPSYKIAVLDLKHVNETYSIISVSAIHGVIGSDLLVDFNAVINLKKQVLRLSPEKQNKS
jgi:predicted aspartyl protease